MKLPICIAAVLCLAGVARADSTACWDDESREDVTCVKVTEELLLSLRGQTIEAVRKAMKAPGRGIENSLHFLSNYSRGEKPGSRDVNVIFEDGRATVVSASVDSLENNKDSSNSSGTHMPPLRLVISLIAPPRILGEYLFAQTSLASPQNAKAATAWTGSLPFCRCRAA